MEKNYSLYLAGVITESEYYDLTEGRLLIKGSDKVRKEIANIMTYWDKPGLALTEIQNILYRYGYSLTGMPSFSVSDKTPEHTERIGIEKLRNPEKPDEGSDLVENMLIFSWHWMPSGNKVEINAYIS
jgi:hypothetical protein